MKVFVTKKIPERGINMLLETGYDVVVSKFDRTLSKDELIFELKDGNYDAVLCLLTDKIDADVFDAGINVKIFANYAVGFNNIDIVEAKKRGVVVTNTPDVLTESVAEFTFSLLLAVSKRIVEADYFIHKGKFVGWEPNLLLGSDIRGKTLGVLGAGRIGTRVAEIGKNGFNMRIIYNDLSKNDSLEKIDAEFYSVEDVLKQADFISIHVPLLESTKHFINAKRLAFMKRNAYLINTSRGAVIDEIALVDALKNNIIRGAALDVFENEPVLAPGLLELENVIITPHIASATEETRSTMSSIAAKNIIAVLSGKNALNAVI